MKLTGFTQSAAVIDARLMRFRIQLHSCVEYSDGFIAAFCLLQHGAKIAVSDGVEWMLVSQLTQNLDAFVPATLSRQCGGKMLAAFVRGRL